MCVRADHEKKQIADPVVALRDFKHGFFVVSTRRREKEEQEGDNTWANLSSYTQGHNYMLCSYNN